MTLVAISLLAMGIGGCGSDKNASDPTIVKQAEDAVRTDAQKTIDEQRGAEDFTVEAVSCKPFSDQQLDCSAKLVSPSGSEAPVGWRATYDPDADAVTVEQRSSIGAK